MSTSAEAGALAMPAEREQVAASDAGRGDGRPRILVLATAACAYPGGDYVGQTHTEYPTSVHIVRVRAPVIFSEAFYFRAFERGIDGILIMVCGQECPYEGAYDRLSKRISLVHAQMKERGMAIERLRACAICTVCARTFVKEVQAMDDYLRANPVERRTGGG